MAELFNHFREPLLQTGMDGSLTDLLEQWHDLMAYTKHYLDPSRMYYFRVWRWIFSSSRKEDGVWCCFWWSFSFFLPISNAKVERLFSLMNRVKTDSLASLSENTLNHLIRIKMEGPPFQDDDPTPAIKLWVTSTTDDSH